MPNQVTAIETEQVKLRLTTDPEVLSTLKANRAYRPNPHHPKKREELILSFDAKPFHFAKDETVIVGRRVANALRRSSTVIIGDALTGEVRYGLEEIGSYDMTQGYQEQRRSITSCTVPGCDKEFDSVAELGKHLVSGHREDRPDLYVDPEKGKNFDTRPLNAEGRLTKTPLNDSSGVGG